MKEFDNYTIILNRVSFIDLAILKRLKKSEIDDISLKDMISKLSFDLNKCKELIEIEYKFISISENKIRLEIISSLKIENEEYLVISMDLFNNNGFFFTIYNTVETLSDGGETVNDYTIKITSDLFYINE